MKEWKDDKTLITLIKAELYTATPLISAPEMIIDIACCMDARAQGDT